MRSFRQTSKENGVYSKTERTGEESEITSIREDEEYAQTREDVFAEISIINIDEEVIDDEEGQAGYRNQGCETIDDMRKKYKEETRNLDGVKMEKAILIAFNRILGPKYTMLRTSSYDDIKNGIDFIILEIGTGIIVCGFDGFVDDKNKKFKDKRYEKKIKKSRQSAQKEGAEIKYGVTFGQKEEKTVLQRKAITNMLTVCLKADKQDLYNLLAGMNYSGDNPSEIELETFDKIMGSLEKQLETLEGDEVAEVLSGSLESFKESLQDMKKIKQNK